MTLHCFWRLPWRHYDLPSGEALSNPLLWVVMRRYSPRVVGLRSRPFTRMAARRRETNER